MPKISFTGWKDPVRRPRYIIWTGIGVLLIAVVMIVALGATSTYWFCANICHKVQDDSIIAYNRSSHSQISCMACHEPVNANPLVFILAKAESLGELYLTATGKYELPLNGQSHYALELKSPQCTQCHSDNRIVTTTQGVLIDHDVHAEKEVQCTYCHNRIAHREDFELTLKNPDGTPSHKHDDFMSMTACFRCHELANDGLERPLKAPGKCTLCHPPNFRFKPPSHLEPDFFPKGHAEMATEAAKVAEEGKAAAEESAAESEGGEAAEEPLGMELPTVAEVNYCATCHIEKVFCNGCHGMEMPHPEEFLKPKTPTDPAGHPVMSKAKPEKCELCHQVKKTDFCNKCHHGTEIKWDYKTAPPWINQHAKAVGETGIDACTEKCHTTTFCSDCHTKKKPFPTSHKDSKWLHDKVTVTIPGKEPAKPSAVHATSAISDVTTCEICHGKGGPNAAFCKTCHRLEMPHPDQFKEFHSKTGKSKPTVCLNCHRFKQICSNCHHIDSSLTKPWIAVHGPSVSKNGSAGCVEKCHQKKDCVACHTTRKVVPASHKTKNFVRRTNPKVPASHTALYGKNAESCTFCHGDGGPNAPFCKRCHKLEMPHPIDESNAQKFPHKEEFEKKQYNKVQCANCHSQYFCDSCHHKGAVPNKPWRTYHPNVVKKTGAEACFECHKETFCSYCHVRLNR